LLTVAVFNKLTSLGHNAISILCNRKPWQRCYDDVFVKFNSVSNRLRNWQE